MKIETNISSGSNLKTWRTPKDEASHDLFLACVSFLALLFVAVADATLSM